MQTNFLPVSISFHRKTFYFRKFGQVTRGCYKIILKFSSSWKNIFCKHGRALCLTIFIATVVLLLLPGRSFLWDHRIIHVRRDLSTSLTQPSSSTRLSHELGSGAWGCLWSSLDKLQGWWLRHLPGQPVALPHCVPRKIILLISVWRCQIFDLCQLTSAFSPCTVIKRPVPSSWWLPQRYWRAAPRCPCSCLVSRMNKQWSHSVSPQGKSSSPNHSGCLHRTCSSLAMSFLYWGDRYQETGKYTVDVLTSIWKSSPISRTTSTFEAPAAAPAGLFYCFGPEGRTAVHHDAMIPFPSSLARGLLPP